MMRGFTTTDGQLVKAAMARLSERARFPKPVDIDAELAELATVWSPTEGDLTQQPEMLEAAE